MSRRLSLFEGYGIEIEYMIVDKNSLAVTSIADELMKKVAGEYVSDFEDGDITWSNELVSHVIELKTSGPAPSLAHLETSFHRSATRINAVLDGFSAQLMPTAMHPFMNPLTETRLWQHDNNEVYESYDRIFSCKGHGWSNLQSVHINLPFANDDEFRRLHSAIRFLLPILPALTASSPIVDGIVGETRDNRLLQYQKNQIRIPSIAGLVIPDVAHSKADYFEKILNPIFADIAPHDPDEILRDDWLNSRGAIARFERQTIEIRVLDTQECPKADIAITDLIVAAVKKLAYDDSVLEQLESFSTRDLKGTLDTVIQNGENAAVSSARYIELLTGRSEGTLTAGQLWQQIHSGLQPNLFSSASNRKLASEIIKAGTLSSRILKRLNGSTDRASIQSVYSELCTCLRENKIF